jgi:hypothetical protein
MIYGLCKYSYIYWETYYEIVSKKMSSWMIFSDKKYNRNEKLFRVGLS